ncbi:hypothetical protein DL771_011047 [Monosporascus sp. 5C6A]|nr:hypothetical protein DL771_011047 [Monosporascus sp. 5C6A]
MRLLKLQDDGSFSLTKDLINNIPPYAILSHTWGRVGEEVTFEDIRRGKDRSKPGYRKIEFCGRQAALDGLRYFWVDTCCINKSNHSELTEAINLMFHWYNGATRCYVYLSDVSKGGSMEADGEADGPLQSSWKLEFRRSRWFARGWTLQELIAPSSVEFFGSDNQRLGDKKSLELMLHEITGIAVNALRGSPLSDFGVDERMSWSEGRETKRREDKAYSLLGIFGAYMPVIYGEGEENALERLREVIAFHPGKPILDKLPVAEGAAFDSYAEEHNPTCHLETRVDLLREIKEWAHNPDSTPIFWLNGASYFFKSGDDDRGRAYKLFSTLAAQLIHRRPALMPYIWAAINRDPAVCDMARRKQFEKLILEPLSKFSMIPLSLGKNNPTIIIIDALDECESADDVKLLIRVFRRARTLRSAGLKIFLTSRPEIPIRLGHQVIEGKYQSVALHNISQSVIDDDISIFLTYKLAEMRREYNFSVPEDEQLPADWPGYSHIQCLVKMGIPSFIFAATVHRFLADRSYGNPDENLQKILRLWVTNSVGTEDAALEELKAMLIPEELRAMLIPEGLRALLIPGELRAMLIPDVTIEEYPIVASSSSRTKDPERDSGYASASRPASLTASSQAAFQNGPQPRTSEIMHETTHPPDEIESLASDNDDIGSQASYETTRAEIDGKGLIKMFLAEEPQFRDLCEKAMGKMERQRFAENLRRLLKSFHKSLTKEAVTEPQKAVAGLLRSRRGRLRISWQLATHIEEEQEDVQKQDRLNHEPSPEGKHGIEAWLAQVSHTRPNEAQGRAPAFDIDNESLTSSSDDDRESGEFPHISDLKVFLRQSNSFRTLQKDFILMLLPAELRHVLLSIPKESISVSQEQDLSLPNRLKAWVEDNTQH